MAAWAGSFIADRPLWLEGDAVRLAKIIASLLDNAARFTERGGRITLRAAGDGTRAHIIVRDTGRGFARSPDPGIGLALARALAEMYGGMITAQSDGEGHGAEFVLTLPLVAAHAAAPSVRCRVLVADDNRDAADTLAFILRDLGAEVTVTYDGAQAVDAARTFAPDLALLDIGMPVLDGYAAAQRIRWSRSPAGGRPTTSGAPATPGSTSTW